MDDRGIGWLAGTPGLAAVMCALSLGCGDDSGEPQVSSVDVPKVPNQVAVDVRITGSRFFADVQLDLDSDDAPQIDRRFRVAVGSVELASQSISLVDASTLDVALPAGLPIGVHDIVVTGPSGLTGVLTGGLTVADASVRVEDAAAGAGAEVGDAQVVLDTTLDLYAVARFDDDDAYWSDIPVDWSVTGTGGSIDTETGEMTTFTGLTIGTSRVTATHAAFGQGETGTLEVSGCFDVSDCADPCRSTNDCVTGLCVEGPVDKDSDSDTFIDAMCDGGNDCDDAASSCTDDCAADGDTDGVVDCLDLCWDDDDDQYGTDQSAVIVGGGTIAVAACTTDGTTPCAFGDAVCAGADCDDDPLACGSDCSPANTESTANGNCADGNDNDCDLQTDAADLGCGGSNTPPLAEIFVSPGVGDTTTVFMADAAGTFDYEEASVNLVYSWDWDGDGTFEQVDVGPTTTHTFSAIGDYEVAVRVEDSGLLAGYASFHVSVIDPGDIVVVTTPIDENDANATPGAPGGAGLSLREAITYVNTTAGKQTILVPAGFTITLGGQLSSPNDGAGMDLYADGAIVVGGGATCLVITSSSNRIFGLELHGCDTAIHVSSGMDNEIIRCELHDNVRGVQVNASGTTVGPHNVIASNTQGIDVNGVSTVERNRVHDNLGDGIYLLGSSDGSVIWGNTLYRNDIGVRFGPNVSSDQIVHNVIHNSVGNGVHTVVNSDTIDFRNNLITDSGSWGITGSDGRFSFRDNNAYFGNSSGECSSCSALGPNSLTDDPLYMMAASDDYRLLPPTTLANAGIDLGFDLNGPEPNDFNPTGADIGAWESPY